MDTITVTVIDRENTSNTLEAPTDIGLNIMELCKVYELPVAGTCGGMALCASCHVYVLSEHELPPPTDDELAMLDAAFFVQSNSRLGCQLKIKEEMNGLILQLAPVEA
jgi:2Fe-2S ferredoxin